MQNRAKFLLLGAAFAGLGHAASMAAQVNEVAVLPAAEDARIADLARDFFAGMAKNGIEAAMRAKFAGSDEVVSAANLENYRLIDAQCGRLSDVELIERKDFGSRAARRSYVSSHGTCLLKWDFTFQRTEKTWSFVGFSFKTLDGNNW
ncbi:hypothetical protein [Porphyrobacter sp. AAP82]|uniref:hypothetical protein n=1 Tax=Porphyrobacter sp. AAP82 TaxID=1248917 RepID=UPI0005271080|nr:hypothetical protein [Porphyrobacter sp. AAP82]